MQTAKKWIIILIAFDDSDIDAQVLKERIPVDEDEHVAAFLRGGELLDVLADDAEEMIEGYRREIEKECLR